MPAEATSGAAKQDATHVAAIKVKLGAAQPMTGNIAQYGEETTNGIKLAIKDVNARGKVLFDLKIADDKSEAIGTVNAVRKLIDIDRVNVIIGSVASTCTMAAAGHAQAARIPMMSSASTNSKVTTPVDQKGNRTQLDYVSRVCFIDEYQGKAAAIFAYQDLGSRKAAIMFDAEQDYSKGLRDVFKQVFEQMGGKVVSEESFVTGDKDFGGVLANVKRSAPDCVFLPAYYNQVGIILSQARGKGLECPFIGCDGWDNDKIFELAGKAARGCYFTTHFSPDDPDPMVQDFVKKYKEAYQRAPGALAALGYDAVLAVADACERAGSNDPTAIKNAINTIKDLKVVSGVITLDENRNPVKSVVIMKTLESSTEFLKRWTP